MSPHGDATPSAKLRERILAMGGKERSPARARTRALGRRVAVVGVAATIALFFVLGGVHRGARGWETIALCTALWTAVALVATWAGMRKRGMLGPPTRVLVGLALAVAPALALTTQPFVDRSAEALRAVPTWIHVACFVATLLYASIPLATFLVLRRRTDPVHPGAFGAALGAAAGAWGSVLIELHCPVMAHAHVLLGHVVPVAVLAAIGAALGRALLAVSPRNT